MVGWGGGTGARDQVMSRPRVVSTPHDCSFPYLLLYCSLELLYPMSSVVETQRYWVFMLAHEQDIPELLYKCQKLGSSQILVIHHFF